MRCPVGDVINFPTRFSGTKEPALVLCDLDTKAEHVIETDTFKKIVTGELRPDILPPGVHRRVILEWLINLGVTS
jgi:hypothetical protein